MTVVSRNSQISGLPHSCVPVRLLKVTTMLLQLLHSEVRHECYSLAFADRHHRLVGGCSTVLSDLARRDTYGIGEWKLVHAAAVSEQETRYFLEHRQQPGDE